MKKNKRIWSWALAGALAVSNLSVVAAPFTGIVALAARTVSDDLAFAVNGEVLTATAGSSNATFTHDWNASKTGESVTVSVAKANKTGSNPSYDINGLSDAHLTDVVFTYYVSGAGAANYTVEGYKSKANTGDNDIYGNPVAASTTAYYDEDCDGIKITVSDESAGALTIATKMTANFVEDDGTSAAVTYAAQTLTLTGTVVTNADVELSKDVVLNKALTSGAITGVTVASPKQNGTALTATSYENVTYELSDDTYVKITAGDTTKKKNAGNNNAVGFELTDAGKALKTSQKLATLTVSGYLNTAAPKKYQFKKVVDVTNVAPTTFVFDVTATADGNGSLEKGTVTVGDKLTIKHNDATAGGGTPNGTLTFGIKSDVTLDAIDAYSWTLKKSAGSAGNFAFTGPAKSVTSPTAALIDNPADGDVEDTIIVTVIGHKDVNGVTTYYEGEKEFTIAVDNVTIDAEMPEELFVGETFDLDDIAVSYDNKPVTNVEWGVLTSKGTAGFGGYSETALVLDPDTNVVTAAKADTAKAIIYVKSYQESGNLTKTSVYANDGAINTFNAPQVTKAIADGKVYEVLVSGKLNVVLENSTVEVDDVIDLSKVKVNNGKSDIPSADIVWSIKGDDSDKIFKKDYPNHKLTAVGVGKVTLRATVNTAYGEVEIEVKEKGAIEKEAAIAAAEDAAAKAVTEPTEANIKAAKDAVDAAKALGATADELKAATDKIAQAEAAKAKNDAITAADAAADKAVAEPTEDNIKAAKDAVAAAEAAGATEEDLADISAKIDAA
ncbi:hypothetical protein, partial [Butyrivibrio sp. WCE2006]|uniref:hypothetical protein n=1 Tax=Butyrivibrio sp. WCE2006 TaxID=1410611 RepID=UPI002E8E5329